jgi:hypothetical protein
MTDSATHNHDEDELDFRTIPYFANDDEWDNEEIQNILDIFALLINDGLDSRGMLDVEIFDAKGEPIPVKHPSYLSWSSSLTINCDEEDSEWTEELEHEFGAWLNNLVINSQITDEFAKIELMKFEEDDEQLTDPVVTLVWHIHDGRIISVKNEGDRVLEGHRQIEIAREMIHANMHQGVENDDELFEVANSACFPTIDVEAHRHPSGHSHNH